MTHQRMKSKWTAVLAILLLTTAVVAATHGTFVLVNGMVEGPDPIPTDWSAVLSTTAGASSDFGTTEIQYPSAVAYQGASGFPAVIWEYPSGADSDIAFTMWEGDDWGRIEFLSSSTYDELDPGLVFDDRDVGFAVWWQQFDGGSVHVARRSAGGFWYPADVRRGARPVVTVHEGVTQVLFERAVPRGMEVVHMRVSAEGDIQETTLARTRNSEATLVQFHSANGRLWANWQHTANKVAWSELVGTEWVAPESLP